jgi:prepilin peptidase CpaA
MILAATSDVLSRRIPNRLTMLVAVSFVVMALTGGIPHVVILMHVCAGLGLLIVGYALFLCGWLGGGDAKLLAAAGLWLGVSKLAAFLALTVFAGGILALAVLTWSLIVFDAEVKDSPLSRRVGWIKPTLPYGYAISAGALLAFSQTQ